MLGKTVLVGAIIVAAILVSSAAYDHAFATIDMFIKMDPIKGESTVTDHEEQIDILSYSFDVIKQVTSVGPTPPSFGKTSFMFSFTHFLDAATPQLYTHVAEGRTIQEATLELCQPASGNKLLCYMEYKFLNPVLFPSVMTDGSASDFRPVEKVSLLFCEVEWKYTSFDSKGSPKSPIEGRFDLCDQSPRILDTLVDDQSTFSFAGAQVVWVVISDPDIDDTDEAKGEPDVKVNDNALRMAQGVDGKWYGFVADRDNALIADFAAVGTPGMGSDFGVFCSKDSGIVIGDSIDTTKTEGFAIQNPSLVTNAVEGNADATPLTNLCSAPVPNPIPDDLMAVLNGEVDLAPFPSAESAGQIGVRQGFWPFIQLYQFVEGGNVMIQYQKGGETITRTLSFDSVS